MINHKMNISNTDINTLLESYNEIPQNQIEKLVYDPGTIQTPFVKKTQITYADYIASGRPSPYIENYLIKKIYPLYSNTHSNAFNGIYMKNIIADTKKYIREQFNLSDDYQIIFSGSGTTSAINHLSNCLDYSKYQKVVIYISLYEHYSNHLPWQELANNNPHIELKLIPFVKTKPHLANTGLVDLNWLNESLNEVYKKSTDEKTLIICSISACSNITGIINPLGKIRELLDLYPNNSNFFKYFFADYACSAPYVNIDGSILDAFFFSPHKFIGGTATPGILIGRRCIFSKPKPFCSGGGCVKKASSKIIEYETDIERRETAGTPNIIGIIKVGKILQLKKHCYELIHTNETILANIIKMKIAYFESKYPTFKSVLYADNVQHLPILSFGLTNLHYNFIVVLLNDLFGIQTRGGIGCCGLLAEYIENNYGYRGWCRVSFHWLMSKSTISDIFEAIEYIIVNGHKFLKYYEYDSSANLYKCIKTN